MFIDGELKEGSEPLEQVNKKRKNVIKTAADNPKSIQVSLFVPYVSTILVIQF